MLLTQKLHALISACEELMEHLEGTSRPHVDMVVDDVVSRARIAVRKAKEDRSWAI